MKHAHDDDEQLRKLLRLKRYENPGEDYFADFLAEHRSRRAEWVQQQATRGFFAKLQDRLDDLMPSTANGWTAVSAAATAMVVFGILVMDVPQPQQAAPGMVAETQAPVSAEPRLADAPTATQFAEALPRPVVVGSDDVAQVEFSEDSLPVFYSDLISPVQYSSQPSQDRLLRRHVLVPVIIRNPLSHQEALDLLSPDYRHPDPEDASSIHTTLDDVLMPVNTN